MSSSLSTVDPPLPSSPPPPPPSSNMSRASNQPSTSVPPPALPNAADPNAYYAAYYQQYYYPYMYQNMYATGTAMQQAAYYANAAAAYQQAQKAQKPGTNQVNMQQGKQNFFDY